MEENKTVSETKIELNSISGFPKDLLEEDSVTVIEDTESDDEIVLEEPVSRRRPQRPSGPLPVMSKEKELKRIRSTLSKN